MDYRGIYDDWSVDYLTTLSLNLDLDYIAVTAVINVITVLYCTLYGILPIEPYLALYLPYCILYSSLQGTP